jgi:hypothetical protein
VGGEDGHGTIILPRPLRARFKKSFIGQCVIREDNQRERNRESQSVIEPKILSRGAYG